MKRITLFLMMLSFFIVSCTKSSDSLRSPEAITLDNNKSSLTLQNLDPETRQQINSSLEKDKDNRVVSFSYTKLVEKYGKDGLRDILYELTNSSKLTIHESEDPVGTEYTDNPITTMSAGEQELPPSGQPTPHIYMDKKNYYRPGCKKKIGYVCILWY
ncbi:MAG: hypothetical protein ACK4E8_12430 [Lacibacter sp.]